MEEQEHNQQGELVSLMTQERFEELVAGATKFTERYKTNANGWNLLALGYKKLGNIAEAQNIFEKLLLNNPENVLFLSNLGNIYKELGRLNDAISCYEKAINGDPTLINALEALGITYTDTGRVDEAIDCFEKILALDESRQHTLYYLAVIHMNRKSFEEALEYIGKTTSKRGKIQELECIYRLGKKEIFKEKYAKLVQGGISTPLLGSIGAHASVRYCMGTHNTFCSNPIAYIKRWHIHEADGLDDKLIGQVIEYNNENDREHMTQPLLTNGRQSTGNMFLVERDFMKALKQIVTAYIEKYRLYFISSNEGFLNNWPNDANLYGWVVSMRTGGNLKPHMHKEGWISGSLYLNVPNIAGSSEGSIGFSLQGDDLPADGKKFPKDKVVEVKKGDICIFPSSLFHYTIPFSSEQERVSFAFDLIPIQ